MARRINLPVHKLQSYVGHEDQLFKEYWEVLRKKFYSATKCDHDAQDLASETITQYLEYMHKRGEILNKAAEVLSTIATRIRGKYHRYLKGQCNLDDYDEVIETYFHDYGKSDPARLMVVNRAVDEIESYMSTLPERDREVFYRRYVDQDRGVEVAKATQISPNYVNLIMYRVRNELKDFLDGKDFAPQGDWKYDK